MERLPICESFEWYETNTKRDNPYYRIYVANSILSFHYHHNCSLDNKKEVRITGCYPTSFYMLVAIQSHKYFTKMGDQSIKLIPP